MLVRNKTYLIYEHKNVTTVFLTYELNWSAGLAFEVFLETHKESLVDWSSEMPISSPSCS